MKCILCHQRKGKRLCPAKGGLICAQCCGEKRILEIDCPESCQYLQVGRAHEARHESARHLATSDPRKQEVRARILEHFEGVVGQLEYRIAQQRHVIRDLKDTEVGEALDLVLASYRTEDKGILYEQSSSNLRVEAIRRELRESVESLRRPEDSRHPSLRLSDAIACLEFVRDLVGSHIEARESKSSYVDFLARMMPRGAAAAPPQGSPLIIPG